MGDIDEIKSSYNCNEQQKHSYEPIGFGHNGEEVTKVWSKELGYQGIVCVKTFHGPHIEDELSFVRRLRHHNLTDVLGISYDMEAEMKASVIYEFMPIAIIYLCEQTHAHLNELTLAAIMGQVCQGLTYLENAGLQNTIFSKSRVLADLNGTVKLRVDPGCEPCYYPLHLLALTQHVMFPWKLRRDMAETEDKWPEESDAMEFWNTLANATTIGDVVKCGLLKLPWRTEHVRELLGIALWQNDTLVLAPKQRNCDRQISPWQRPWQ